MGVHGLWQLLQPVARPIKLETLEGKRLAIDSSIWLYHFQMAMRDKEGKTLSNAHILGFLWRILKLLFHGIRPVFVFDGGAPVIKRKTLSGRRARKQGAKESHARTAEKLLAAQLRQAAIQQITGGQTKSNSANPIEDGLDENTVYYDDLDQSKPQAHPSRLLPQDEASVPFQSRKPGNEASPSKSKKQDWHKDPYALPALETDLNTLNTENGRNGKKVDYRFPTETELRAVMSTIAPEDLDIDSELFRSLPPELQYELVGDLRAQSRMTSYKRLQSMLASAPTPIDFSRAQVAGLKTRNELTQKAFTVTDEIGKAHIKVPVRIAGERNKEYVLIRNPGAEGGFVLGVRDAGTCHEKAIDVDALDENHQLSEDEQNRQTDSEIEFEMEDVEIPPPSAPSPKSTAVDPDIQALHREADPFRRKEKAMELLQARANQIAAQARKEAGLDEQEFEISKILGGKDDEKPLFIKNVQDGPVFTEDDVEFVDLAVEENEDDDDPRYTHIAFDDELEEDEAHDLARALAESRKDLDSFKKRPNTLGSSSLNPSTWDVNGSGLVTREGQQSSPYNATRSSPMMYHGAKASTSQSPNKHDPLLPKTNQSTKVADDQVDDVKEEDFEEVEILMDAGSPSQTVTTPINISHNEEITLPELGLSTQYNPQNEASPSQPSRLGWEREDAMQKGIEKDRSEKLHPQHQMRSSTPDQFSEQNVLPDMPPEPTEIIQSPPRATAIPDSLELPREARPKVDPFVSTKAHNKIANTGKDFVEYITPDTGREALVCRDEMQQPIPTDQSEASPPEQDRKSGSTSSLDPIQIVEEKSAASPADHVAHVENPFHGEQPAAGGLGSREGTPIEWSPSPSPEPVVLGADGFPLPTAEELEALDAEDEEDFARLNADQNGFAAFLSATKGKSLLEVQKEVENEVNALRAEHANSRKSEEDITRQMAQEIQMMLRLFGLPYVTAPMEAEAQCAELVSRKLVDGIITDDSDVFLFGGTRIYKNMFNNNKLVECFLLSDLQRELGLDREKLVLLAYLLGSDYTEGLPGVGPVVAMEILALFPGQDGLLKFRDWWMKVQMGQDTPQDTRGKTMRRIKKGLRNKVHLSTSWPEPEVLDAYYQPAVDESDESFQWGLPDLDSLRTFLGEYLHWTVSKTDQYLLPIIEKQNQRNRSRGNQTTLDRNGFFDISAGTGVYSGRKRPTYGSSRLQEVVNGFRAATRGKAATGTARARSSQARTRNASSISSENDSSDSDGIELVQDNLQPNVSEEMLGKEMAKKRPIVRPETVTKGSALTPADRRAGLDAATEVSGQKRRKRDTGHAGGQKQDRETTSKIAEDQEDDDGSSSSADEWRPEALKLRSGRHNAPSDDGPVAGETTRGRGKSGRGRSRGRGRASTHHGRTRKAPSASSTLHAARNISLDDIHTLPGSRSPSVDPNRILPRK